MKALVAVLVLVLMFASPVFADKVAEVMTPWIGDGTPKINPRRPLLSDVFGLTKWGDVTGQPVIDLPPDPNLYVIKIQCSDAVLDSILLDDRFLIIWSSDVPDGFTMIVGPDLPLNASERAHLMVEGIRLGLPPQVAEVAIGASGRGQANKLRNWLKNQGQ